MRISILLFASVVSGHSWIDCITPANITHNGPPSQVSSLIKNCIGFPRAYPGRENPAINDIYTLRINRFGDNNPQAPVCGTGIHAQHYGNYSRKYPMTKVKAGTSLKLWYTMNGHYFPVSTQFIYSYAQPNKEIKVRGELVDKNKLFVQKFALPKNCRNVTDSNTLCWFNFKIPETWSNGIYSMVWYWPWNSNPAGEEYFTCFDIQVASSNNQVQDTRNQHLKSSNYNNLSKYKYRLPSLITKNRNQDFMFHIQNKSKFTIQPVEFSEQNHQNMTKQELQIRQKRRTRDEYLITSGHTKSNLNNQKRPQRLFKLCRSRSRVNTLGLTV